MPIDTSQAAVGTESALPIVARLQAELIAPSSDVVLKQLSIADISDSPIHKLPSELLCSIFLRLSFIHRLQASLVCSMWRAALLGNRILWTDIHAREGPELQTFLARGCDEIKLHLWLTNRHQTHVRGSLTKYRHAVHELHIHSVEESAMATTMQSLCMDWPMLKVLHLHRDVAVGVQNPSFVTMPRTIFGCGNMVSDSVTTAPNLHSLIIRGPILAPLVTLIQLAGPTSSNLRELVLLSQLRAVHHALAFQILSELPQLELFIVGIDTSQSSAPMYLDAVVGEGSSLRRLGIRFSDRLGGQDDALQPLHEDVRAKVQLSTWQVAPSAPNAGYTDLFLLERDHDRWDLLLGTSDADLPPTRRHLAVPRIMTKASCSLLFRSPSVTTLVRLTLDTSLLFDTRYDPVMEHAPPLLSVESINIIVSPEFPAFGHMDSSSMRMLFPLTVDRLPSLRSVRVAALESRGETRRAKLVAKASIGDNIDIAFVSFFELQTKESMRRLEWIEIAGIATQLTHTDVAAFTNELHVRHEWVPEFGMLDRYDELLVAG